LNQEEEEEVSVVAIEAVVETEVAAEVSVVVVEASAVVSNKVPLLQLLKLQHSPMHAKVTLSQWLTAIEFLYSLV